MIKHEEMIASFHRLTHLARVCGSREDASAAKRVGDYIKQQNDFLKTQVDLNLKNQKGQIHEK